MVYNYGSGEPGDFAVCPIGQVGEVLKGSNKPDSEDSPYYDEDSVYYNGWNEGPCAAANGELNESSEDNYEYNLCS